MEEKPQRPFAWLPEMAEIIQENPIKQATHRSFVHTEEALPNSHSATEAKIADIFETMLPPII